MARTTLPPPAPKHFRPEEIEPGIKRLGLRIAEVQKLIDEKIHEGHPRVGALEKSIRSTIAGVFGSDSLEYDVNKYFQVDRVQKRVTVNLSRNRCAGFGGGFPSQQSTQMGEEARRGYEAAIVELKVLVESIEEQGAVYAQTPVKPELTANSGYTLHPRAAAVAAQLFHDGYYRQAATDGFLALRDMVREASGLGTDLDGAPLMIQAFTRGGPLRMSEDPDEQQGAMFLYAGAAAAVRNPRVHNLDPDTADEGRELLGFLSFLARELKNAKKG